MYFSIVLLRYISQACWVASSPRLDFFHHTVISTLVAANRTQIPIPLLPDPSQSYSLQRPCYDKDLHDRFLFIQCTDTGVIVTHALSFYRPLAPLFLLTHAQLAVVIQSCALLYIAAHCDLLLQ